MLFRSVRLVRLLSLYPTPLVEHLLVVFYYQVFLSRLKGQLDEEEAKNMKLLQQISKLEEQVSTTMEQSTRREEVGCAQ